MVIFTICCDIKNSFHFYSLKKRLLQSTTHNFCRPFLISYLKHIVRLDCIVMKPSELNIVCFAFRLFILEIRIMNDRSFFVQNNKKSGNKCLDNTFTVL